jgi:hypothetical protein
MQAVQGPAKNALHCIVCLQLISTMPEPLLTCPCTATWPVTYPSVLPPRVLQGHTTLDDKNSVLYTRLTSGNKELEQVGNAGREGGACGC